VTATIEDLLIRLDQAYRGHIVNPTPAAAGDALAVVRRIVRYASELSGLGFGEEPIGRDRQRETDRLVAAGNRVLREGAGILPTGPAGDFAGAAIDAMRTSRPPLSADERWAVMGRLEQPLARAVNILTASTELPSAVAAYSTVRSVGEYMNADHPRYESLTRLDDVIPSPANELPPVVGPQDYGDRLSLIAAQARAGLEERTLTVRDTLLLAETSLAVADTARRTYAAAGLPELSDTARGCAQTWADLRHHLANNVDDGLARHADSTLARDTAALYRSVLSVGLDPNLARRPDLAAQLAGLGQATARLPELGSCIGARAEQWERTGGIRQREELAHPTFAADRYPGCEWDESFLPSHAKTIADLAGQAAVRSAALSVAIEQQTDHYPCPSVSAANRDLMHTGDGGRAAAARLAQREPAKSRRPPSRAARTDQDRGVARSLAAVEMQPRIVEPEVPWGPDLGR